MIASQRDNCIRFFSEILHVLKSTSQYEQVLHLLTDRIMRLYRCQTCAVILIDQKTEYLNVENSVGLSYTFCKEYRKKLATGAIGELLWTGKPICVADSAELPGVADDVKLEHAFGSCLAVQIAIDQRTLGYLYADSKEKATFGKEDIPVMQAMADLAGIAVNKASLHDENLRLETVDRESGLEKYTPFIEKVNAALERGEKFIEPFAVMILDVDNYKRIVNTFGYDVSKQFIKELGGIAKSMLRQIDAAGRYGYDEIAIMLANTGLDDAIEHARKLRVRVETTKFTSHAIETTISIGIAAYPQNGKTTGELVQTAKQALFEAQRAGRNNVFYYSAEWYAGQKSPA